MQQLHLFKILITPSPFSLVVIFILSIAWVFSNSWLHFSDNQLIYQYVFGPQAITTHTWAGTESVIAWATKFFSSSAGYYVLLTMFGLFTGVAAFTLLETFTHIIKGIVNFVQRSEDAAEPAALLEIFTRLWIRCATLVGWAVFIAVTIGSILPLLDILIDTGANHLGNYSLTGGLFYAQALILCMIALHMHIVFTRLFLLRPRVFGNRNI